METIEGSAAVIQPLDKIEQSVHVILERERRLR